MIIGSLLLLVAGAAFLVVGLIIGNDAFLIGTIVSSLMAAVCLYAGSRVRPGAANADGESKAAGGDRGTTDSRLGEPGRRRRGEASAAAEPSERHQPRQQSAERKNARQGNLDVDVETDAVPSDEPSEAKMSSVEAAALMRMDAEVMVVDGRPRFHLGGCVHLVGRSSESLPAYEAVELGFSACSLCRPAQSLLREPTRR